MSSPFEGKGMTTGNISHGNDGRSSTSEVPPPYAGSSGDGASAAAILTDEAPAVDEAPASVGASSTALDGLVHTPPVLAPPVPSGEGTSGQSVPRQDNDLARVLADVTDHLGALEDVLRNQRQSFPIQS